MRRRIRITILIWKESIAYIKVVFIELYQFLASLFKKVVSVLIIDLSKNLWQLFKPLILGLFDIIKIIFQIIGQLMWITYVFWLDFASLALWAAAWTITLWAWFLTIMTTYALWTQLRYGAISFILAYPIFFKKYFVQEAIYVKKKGRPLDWLDVEFNWIPQSIAGPMVSVYILLIVLPIVYATGWTFPIQHDWEEYWYRIPSADYWWESLNSWVLLYFWDEWTYWYSGRIAQSPEMYYYIKTGNVPEAWLIKIGWITKK